MVLDIAQLAFVLTIAMLVLLNQFDKYQFVEQFVSTRKEKMMRLFTEKATHCINKIISANGFEVLPEVIRQHTDLDYAYQQKHAGCNLKPTFRNMPYRNSFVPEIDIIIFNRDSQTELQMIGQPIKFVRIFMASWFSFLLTMEVFFIILAITSNLDSLFPLFIPLAMCAFGYLLCKLATKATFSSVVKAIKKEFY